MPIASATSDRADASGGVRAPQWRGHALTLAATCLVATSFPVGAAITEGLDSLVLTLLRFTAAALLFAPFVIWRYGLKAPGLRDLARYALLSACLVGFFWAMFSALRYTSALNTAAIYALTPVITALAAWFLLRERIGGAAGFALLLGVLGSIWVVFRGDLTALTALDLGHGDLIFLAGTVSMGAYAALVRRLHRGEPMAQMTFWTLVTGAFWLLVLSAPRIGAIEWSAVPGSVVLGIAYLAIFTTLTTFFIQQWSVTVIGPTKVMSYTFLNPALVMLLGLALGEALPPAATYPGMALVVGATFVLQRSKPAPAATVTPEPKKTPGGGAGPVELAKSDLICRPL